MKYLLKYKIFEEESYLKGGRAPIYHYTHRLEDIIKSDMLKIGTPARGPLGICVTRQKEFGDHSMHGSCRLVLDVDKLKSDGYNPQPVDEIGLAQFYTKNGRERLRKNPAPKNSEISNHMKSNFDEFKKGMRGTYHGIEDLPKIGDITLPYEYEERIYRDIKNIGKYIISIDFPKGSIIDTKLIKEYQVKYPQIEVKYYNPKKPWI
jgi:hypothetical protein